jgi:hypothetical protein
MATSKRQKRLDALFWFAWLGMVYFNAFSSWEMDAGVRLGVAIVPILIGVIYAIRRTAPGE